MIDKYEELQIDDFDGAVTLFKSTDEGTETIAVFDEEHREVVTYLAAEVNRLREAILEFADYLEEKVTPYMTNDMHEVVPIGGMVDDLHKMIKGDD